MTKSTKPVCLCYAYQMILFVHLHYISHEQLVLFNDIFLFISQNAYCPIVDLSLVFCVILSCSIIEHLRKIFKVKKGLCLLRRHNFIYLPRSTIMIIMISLLWWELGIDILWSQIIYLIIYFNKEMYLIIFKRNEWMNEWIKCRLFNGIFPTRL